MGRQVCLTTPFLMQAPTTTGAQLFTNIQFKRMCLTQFDLHLV